MTRHWSPRVLSEYEIGSAVAAIEAVKLLEKPIAEVGCRRATRADLEDDLQNCLILARADADGIRFWVRPVDDSFRFGFYREAWVLDALDFLDRTQLDNSTRAWVSGLLFGYRAGAIQQFIDRAVVSDLSAAS